MVSGSYSLQSTSFTRLIISKFKRYSITNILKNNAELVEICNMAVADSSAGHLTWRDSMQVK